MQVNLHKSNSSMELAQIRDRSLSHTTPLMNLLIELFGLLILEFLAN